MRPAVPTAMALALLATACAGPVEPLVVTHKEVASDALIPKPPRPPVPPALVPPTALQLDAPSFFAPTPPPASVPGAAPTAVVTTPTTAGVAPACPAADPRIGPAVVARNRIVLPPVPASYTFRNEGTYERGGAGATTERRVQESTRTVKDVQRVSSNLWRYTVSAPLGDTVTDTTYQLDTTTAADNTGGGLSVTRIVTTTAGRSTTFSPTPAITLVSFPFEPGKTTNTSAATDPNPSSATTIRYESVVGQKTRVDACGVPLDAYTVTLKASVVARDDVGPTNITAVYAIAPQYGGLVVADDLTVDGSEGGNPVRRTNKAIINREPQPVAP